MWDDGSGPPLRGRSDHDGRDDHRGYDGGGHTEDHRYDQGLVEYDIPTTFLPVQGAPLTRPRRPVRRRRPVLTVALVTVATVALGSGAGLLMARALDRGTAAPSASVAAAPSTPAGSPSAPVAGTARSTKVTPSVPAVRPTSASTKVSRSDPSRSPKPSPSSKKPTKTAKSSPSSSPSGSKAPAGNAGLEAQVLTIVNKERAKAGCKALTSNAKLVLAARRHSQFMADTGKHAHDGIGDGTPQDRIEKAGYAWRGWGENIAWGYTSAAAVMDGWMNSPGHRANILNCSYTEIGIGVDRGGVNWTQDFGIPA